MPTNSITHQEPIGATIIMIILVWVKFYGSFTNRKNCENYVPQKFPGMWYFTKTIESHHICTTKRNQLASYFYHIEFFW